MGSSLEPTMANVFLSFYEIKWLEQCPKEFKPVFYRRYVDDIFVLFESAEHLSKFRNYFNTLILDIFLLWTGKKWKVVISWYRSILESCLVLGYLSIYFWNLEEEKILDVIPDLIGS